ncbi:MAG TPA: LemA family protein [Longimicrobiales bacterium]|nr:LemA family protein [Longimicrobiales bacterium]
MSWLILAVIVAIAVAVIAIYNALVRLRVLANNAWSDIDVQLKRRYDLIPNLVETVKGYAGHERDTLESVTRARQQAVELRGGTPEQRAQAENMLTQTLRSLFAVSEAYPELRANENFRDLQQTLNSLEDAIQNARRYYNAVVRDYNTKIDVFPSNIVANAFSFRHREFFEVTEPERVTPRVQF